MAYRVRVTWSASQGAFVLDARSAALLCLADGDELVVERVVHRSCPTSARSETPAGAGSSGQPAGPDGSLPAAQACVTPLPGRGGEELATLKRALRMLGD